MFRSSSSNLNWIIYVFASLAIEVLAPICEIVLLNCSPVKVRLALKSFGFISIPTNLFFVSQVSSSFKRGHSIWPSSKSAISSNRWKIAGYCLRTAELPNGRPLFSQIFIFANVEKSNWRMFDSLFFRFNDNSATLFYCTESQYTEFIKVRIICRGFFLTVF